MHTTPQVVGVIEADDDAAEAVGALQGSGFLQSEIHVALRRGGFLIGVETPTEARRRRAAQILGEHGAHSV